MNASVLAHITLRPCRNEHCYNRRTPAFAVVAAKIARVGSRLIDVGLRRVLLPFQFKDQYAAADEQHDIRAPGLHRQLVFEDC
jgi:hypothetical protein